MTNPYSPPDARLEDPPPRRGPPWRAVLTGLAVDIGGSLVLGFMLSFVYGMQLAASGMSESELTSALGNIPGDSWVFSAGMLLGGLMSCLGGYVCARIAGAGEYRLGAVLGVLSAASGVLLGAGTHPFETQAWLVFLTYVSVMAGAHIGARRNRR